MPGSSRIDGIPRDLVEGGVGPKKADAAGWKMPSALLYYAFVMGLFLGCLHPPDESADSGIPEIRTVMTSGVSGTFMRTLLANKRESPHAKSEELMSRDHKLLIVVTGTYSRAFQLMYMTRIAHKLLLVPSPLLWLVVEGASQSEDMADFLKQTGLDYQHLTTTRRPKDARDRAVLQRNRALDYIARERLDGIVYFASDDMVYSLELFDELRTIKRFGAWPVATLSQGRASVLIEGPVCDGTSIIGWHTHNPEAKLRRFQAHTGGYAFNSTLLWDPARWGRNGKTIMRQPDLTKEPLLQESRFVERLVDSEEQMEGLADECSRVLVWHLPLEASPKSEYPRGWAVKRRNLPVKIRVGAIVGEDPPVEVQVQTTKHKRHSRGSSKGRPKRLRASEDAKKPVHEQPQ